MGIGVSLILIAAGAILTFAVHASSSTFNVHAIGPMLMVIGAIGLVTSLVFWSSWGAWAVAAKQTRRLSSGEGPDMPLAIAGTGYGLIGLLVIILLVVMIFYFARRA